jgi:hypothetical protein
MKEQRANACHFLDPHAGFGILNLPAEVAE